LGNGSSDTVTRAEYDVFGMSTSIRITEETKRALEAVKRSGETFDELLARLAVDRTEADVERLAGFAEDGIEEHMREVRSELDDRAN
jgi:predicted CopG family antitoxin